MANFLLPQSPLMRGEDYVYPLTKAEQVVLADGTRLDKGGEIYADRLGGISAKNYALKTDLGITMDLLWENPDTSTTFVDQTINVDLSQYSGYVVFSFFHSTLQLCITNWGLSGSGVLVFCNDSDNLYRRQVTYSNGALDFSSVAGSSTDNDYLIPYRIYGIGGVRNG